MTDRPMTPEYARLSLRAGFLAAAVGEPEVIIYFRRHGWDLTPALLAEFSLIAVACGVDSQRLEYAEYAARVAASNRELMDMTMAEQERRDARRNRL